MLEKFEEIKGVTGRGMTLNVTNDENISEVIQSVVDIYGTIDIYFSTPIPAMACTVPVHKTGLCNCATILAFISSTLSALVASTLCNTSTTLNNE
jgi:predicted membrane chloride channel (bestrophin family)